MPACPPSGLPEEAVNMRDVLSAGCSSDGADLSCDELLIRGGSPGPSVQTRA